VTQDSLSKIKNHEREKSFLKQEISTLRSSTKSLNTKIHNLQGKMSKDQETYSKDEIIRELERRIEHLNKDLQESQASQNSLKIQLDLTEKTLQLKLRSNDKPDINLLD
jgi:predicted RNase H-like nuclease (RuvC/YqgF family)